LIAGIGNIFLGDDAFGVAVAQRLLRERRLPDSVRVVDFGIRGIDLIYAMLDGYETVILVDAAPRGGAPGDIYLIEPEPDETSAPPELGDGHNLDPARVLRLARSLGGRAENILLVGCEPSPMGTERDFCDGLSPPVEAAVDRAIEMIESLVADTLASRSARHAQSHAPV